MRLRRRSGRTKIVLVVAARIVELTFLVRDIKISGSGSISIVLLLL